jgi:ABC-type antimicrobial peptide transport system permease subunit
VESALKAFVFGVSAGSPAVILLSVGGLLATMLISVAGPMIRALRIEPQKAYRKRFSLSQTFCSD